MVDPVIDRDDEDYDFSEDLKYYIESLTQACPLLGGDSATIGHNTSLGIADNGVQCSLALSSTRPYQP
jgi:hypothetical protein